MDIFAFCFEVVILLNGYYISNLNNTPLLSINYEHFYNCSLIKIRIRSFKESAQVQSLSSKVLVTEYHFLLYFAQGSKQKPSW